MTGFHPFRMNGGEQYKHNHIKINEQLNVITKITKRQNPDVQAPSERGLRIKKYLA